MNRTRDYNTMLDGTTPIWSMRSKSQKSQTLVQFGMPISCHVTICVVLPIYCPKRSKRFIYIIHTCQVSLVSDKSAPTHNAVRPSQLSVIFLPTSLIRSHIPYQCITESTPAKRSKIPLLSKTVNCLDEFLPLPHLLSLSQYLWLLSSLLFVVFSSPL